MQQRSLRTACTDSDIDASSPPHPLSSQVRSSHTAGVAALHVAAGDDQLGCNLDKATTCGMVEGCRQEAARGQLSRHYFRNVPPFSGAH